MNYFVDRIVNYSNTKYNKCLKINRAQIPYYDLTFVLEGTMVYYIGGKKYALKKNDAIFLPPGTWREREFAVVNVKYISYNFHFIEGEEIDLPLFMPSVVTEEIKKLLLVFDFPQIFHNKFDHEKCVCILNAILFELLNIKKSVSCNAYVREMLGFISKNINRKITLSDLCGAVHLSKEYVSFLFTKETGKTPVSYINEQKMLYARELILKKEMRLQDVSEYLGFSDYNYFSRIYKKQFGYAPKKTITD